MLKLVGLLAIIPNCYMLRTWHLLIAKDLSMLYKQVLCIYFTESLDAIYWLYLQCKCQYVNKYVLYVIVIVYVPMVL